MQRKFSLGLIAAAALATASVRADDTPAPSTTPTSDEVVRMEAYQVQTTLGRYHEETSSMATKTPTDLKELSSSLEILNSNALQDRDAVTLQDIYPYIVGLSQVSQSANGFTFRGFSNTGTFTQNIEYDGLQGATSAHGALSTANVESVEFLKGPNSVLYGQMHPGGLLNIITKSPQPQEQTTITTSFQTYAGAERNFGSSNGVIGTIDTTGSIDSSSHWMYRLVASAQDYDPFRDGDYEKDIYVYPSLTYRWNSDTFFTVKLEAISEKRREDDGAIPLFTQGITYGPNARYQVSPADLVYQEPSDLSRDRGESLSTYFQSLLPGGWTFRLQTRTAWHTDIYHALSTQAQTVTVGNPLTASTTKRQYNYVINGHRYNYFDTNAYRTMGPQSFENTLLIGVGGGLEYYNNQRFAFGPSVTAENLFDPILGVTPYPADGTKTQSPRDRIDSLGGYASDRIKIAQRVHVSVGTRYDQQESHGIDGFNPVTSPYVHQFVTSDTSQAGVVVDLTSDLSAYGSWSQSFVPNNVTSVDSTGHSGFAPEKGTQYESGLRFETSNQDFYATLAAYQITRVNVLVATGLSLPSGQGYFRLDGGQESRGMEFETQWLPLPYWQFQAGATLSNAWITSSAKNPATVGDKLANAPRGSANLWTRYNIPSGLLRGLGAGLGIIYQGDSWGGDPTTASYFPVTGYARTDLAFYYRWRRYNVSLNLQNLFDRSYILAAQNANQIFLGDPRKLTLSVSTRF